VIDMESLCPWESPQYLIFSSNAPSLLYYSHFVAIFAALIFVYILAFKVKESLVTRIFLFSISCFIVWSVIDVLLWASNRSDLVLFYWSLQILLEMLLYASAFYLAYIFIKQKDLDFYNKLILVATILPIVILLPTRYLLPAIDISYCDAVESSLVIFYTYLIEVIFILSILFVCFREINQSTQRKKEILLFSTGLIIFLLAFSSGNIIGSITENWILAQAGLFGMPLFIAFLAYTVVRFKTFNVKLISTQALVVVLWFLVGSLLLIRTIESIRIITSITLIALLLLGIQLVRGVKREIKQREQIEKLAGELQIANEGQANLIHIINHQIKGYLAKARNVFSELLTEPEYGPISESAKPMMNEGLKSLTEGVDFVTDFLNASNIEKGTYKYEMQPLDIKVLVQNVAEKQKVVAEEKGLSFEVNIAEGDYNIRGDKVQLEQAMRNLIDNSIRYTPSGTINLQLSREHNPPSQSFGEASDKIRLKIEDTGIGISDELKPKLFTKGGRDKNSLKVNVNSTGFGLSFVKDVIEAHHGRVWAESAGVNKGSTFFMKLPI